MIQLTDPMARESIAMQIARTLAGHRYPDEGKRLDRAAAIARSAADQIRPGPLPGTWQVQSQGHSGHWYLVSKEGCTCLDKAAPAGRCKHRLALLLREKARRLQATQYEAEDSRDQARGIATSVSLPGAPTVSCWLLSTHTDWKPRYVPDWALVLGDHIPGA